MKHRPLKSKITVPLDRGVFVKHMCLTAAFLLSSPRLTVDHGSPAHSDKPVTIAQYLRQLSRHKNFMWFASMNLVQVKYTTLDVFHVPYFLHYKVHWIIRRTFNEWLILKLFSYIGCTAL